MISRMPASMSDKPQHDYRFLTGAGRYLSDLTIDGVVEAEFVRSPFAHGRILAVDGSDALALDGVAAVFGAEDLQLAPIPADLRTAGIPPAMSRPPLAREVVRYAGEPIAIVVGTDIAAAIDGAERVFVDIEPFPAVVDVRDSLHEDPLLFPEAGTNVVLTKRTTVGDMPSELPKSVTIDVFHPLLAPNPIEPLGMIAIPADGALTIWCSHQMPHRLRTELSLCLGIDEESIRVRVPDVGGAFGQKGQLNAEYVIIAAAALSLDRPVRWVQRRRDNITVGTHGRGSRTKLTMHGELDGTVRGLEVDVLADAGAYPHSSAFVPLSTHLMASGPYRFEAVDITTTVVTTTTTPTGPYRGAGRPEAAYALERCIEVFARAVGVDVAEVRRKNLVAASDMPYTSPTGAVYDGGDYAEALDLLLTRMGYSQRRHEQRDRRDRDSDPMGIGLAVFLDRTGGSSLTIGEYGSTEVQPDGTVIVRTGTTDSGQGHWPIWRRLAAKALDVDPASVDIITGDTGEVPRGTGTFGSRSSQVGASSVHRTALDVRRQALELASAIFEIDPDDLESDGRGGLVVKGSPQSCLSLAELAIAASERGTPLQAEEYFSPGAQTFPHAAHGAVVTVDIETGHVEIIDYVAIDDCGTILDQAVVHGQVIGSVVQGIGQARYERFAYDDDGQPLTGSFATYSLPHATDVPPITSGHTQTPSPTNPLGTKGVGESGTIGAPAAVMNAIVDALTRWGIDDIPFPADPGNVWQALHDRLT